MINEPMWEELNFGDQVSRGQRLFLPAAPLCAQVSDPGRICALTPSAICVGHIYASSDSDGNPILELKIVKYTPNEEAVLITIIDIEHTPDLLQGDWDPFTAPNFLLFPPYCNAIKRSDPSTNLEVCLTETECTGETKTNLNKSYPIIKNIQKYIIADTLGVVFSYLEFTEYQRHELKAQCLLFRDALPCVSYWTVNFPHPNIPSLTVLMEKIKADKRVKNETLLVIEFPEGELVMEGELDLSKWATKERNAKWATEETKRDGILGSSVHPTRDNITYVGKGKDRTVVHGHFAEEKIEAHTEEVLSPT